MMHLDFNNKPCSPQVIFLRSDVFLMILFCLAYSTLMTRLFYLSKLRCVASGKVWKRRISSRFRHTSHIIGWGPPPRLRSQKGTFQSVTRPPTVHPTMEFPELGVNCSVSHCNQLDFLPVKCDACKSKFCNDHFLYDAHSCPIKHTKDGDGKVHSVIYRGRTLIRGSGEHLQLHPTKLSPMEGRCLTVGYFEGK